MAWPRVAVTIITMPLGDIIQKCILPAFDGAHFIIEVQLARAVVVVDTIGAYKIS